MLPLTSREEAIATEVDLKAHYTLRGLLGEHLEKRLALCNPFIARDPLTLKNGIKSECSSVYINRYTSERNYMCLVVLGDRKMPSAVDRSSGRFEIWSCFDSDARTYLSVRCRFKVCAECLELVKLPNSVGSLT